MVINLNLDIVFASSIIAVKAGMGYPYTDTDNAILDEHFCKEKITFTRIATSQPHHIITSLWTFWTVWSLSSRLFLLQTGIITPGVSSSLDWVRKYLSLLVTTTLSCWMLLLWIRKTGSYVSSRPVQLDTGLAGFRCLLCGRQIGGQLTCYHKMYTMYSLLNQMFRCHVHT